MSSFDYSSSSDSETSPASSAKETVKKVKRRPSRQKALPSKLKDTLNDREELECDLSRSAMVLCPQSGKRHNIKIGKLSKEDGEPLTNDDLFKGALLILDYKGRAYPVEFLEFTDKGSGSKGGKKSNSETSTKHSKASTSKDPTTHITSDGSDTSKSATTENSTIDILMKAKEVETQRGPQKKKPKLSDEDEKDTIAEMAKKVDRIDKTLSSLVDLVKNGGIKDASQVVKAEPDGGDVIINGINIMRLPSRDAYSFALQLLDMLFSKDELASALLFKSKKSDKPALEKGRVEKLLSYVEKRFGTNWDMKTLIAKANQKCRDSKVATESPNDDRED